MKPTLKIYETITALNVDPQTVVHIVTPGLQGVAGAAGAAGADGIDGVDGADAVLVWGSISGEIADQDDLQLALDAAGQDLSGFSAGQIPLVDASPALAPSGLTWAGGQLTIAGPADIAGDIVTVTSKNKYRPLLMSDGALVALEQTAYWNGSAFVDTHGFGFGTSALQSNTGSNSNGFGYYALYSSSGNSSNGFGNYTLYSSSGNSSNGFGDYALYSSSGSHSNGFGTSALRDNTGGNSNGFGGYALRYNTGDASNGFGYYSLRNNTGARSGGFGQGAGENNTGGYSNGFGYFSLRSNTGAYSNGFGYAAGENNTLGNTTHIGSYAQAVAANQVMLGGDEVTTVATYGDYLGYRLSSLSNPVTAGSIRFSLPTDTDASFTGRLSLLVADYSATAGRELIRADANGTAGVVVIGDISGGNTATIEADGTLSLQGDATGYEDLNFSPSDGEGNKTTYPDDVTINGVFHKEFTSSNNQQCGASEEIPHSCKLGETLDLHGHIFLKSGESAGTTGVTFTIYWELRQTTGTTSGSATMATTSAALTANGHKVDMAATTDITGPTELGAQLSLRLARTAGDAGDVVVLTYGVHYQIDTPAGSREEDSK